MLLDRALYSRLVEHSLRAIDQTPQEVSPFPHVLIKGVFPEDVFRHLIDCYPSGASFVKANPKHHSNEYGGSTRQRMTMCEDALRTLPPAHHTLWSTVRAAICCQDVRDAIFGKLSTGLCRRFKTTADKLSKLSAFPRGQFYSEVEGYRITPHPDTREKIVTMQFAFPGDESLKEIGTEFYTRSLNPLHFLREPRGFVIAKTMPFLPNYAYAFSVLNDLGLKSWHGRSTIATQNGVRNSLLHIWYAEPDESHRELEQYQQFLRSSAGMRKSA